MHKTSIKSHRNGSICSLACPCPCCVCSEKEGPKVERVTIAPAYLYLREAEGYEMVDAAGSVVPGAPLTIPEVCVLGARVHVHTPPTRVR